MQRFTARGRSTASGILSRIEPQNVRRGMDDGVEDPQARFLAAQIGEIHVVSAYVPNGQIVGSAQYAYKLDWLRRLRAFLAKHFTPETPLVVCGDFNVARDERDVADPAAWEETVLYHPTSRAALEDFSAGDSLTFIANSIPKAGCIHGGTIACSPSSKNDGLRLDYIFATAPLACRCTSTEIDREERKGEKPSDHAPVIAVFTSSGGEK